MCILAHGEPELPKHEAAHSCGKGHLGCVNPKHLSWKTPAGNCADKRAHGTDNRGARNGKTRLSAQDVDFIRSAPPNLKALMDRFGVSKGCISKIRNGSRWSAPPDNSAEAEPEAEAISRSSEQARKAGNSASPASASAYSRASGGY
jgi:hypothetical protein